MLRIQWHMQRQAAVPVPGDGADVSGRGDDVQCLALRLLRKWRDAAPEHYAHRSCNNCGKLFNTDWKFYCHIHGAIKN